MQNWISTSEKMPDSEQRVYVVCEMPKYGGGTIKYQTIAEYIPAMTVKEDDFMHEDYRGEGDYNEKEDEFYTPEGFYESQIESEMKWHISSKVTHWMPLFKLP